MQILHSAVLLCVCGGGVIYSILALVLLLLGQVSCPKRQECDFTKHAAVCMQNGDDVTFVMALCKQNRAVYTVSLWDLLLYC